MTETTPETPQIPRLSSAVAVLMSSNVIGALLAFVISILIGRTTGETGLGIYAAAVAWVFPFALLVDAGIGTLISRDLAYPRMPTSRAYLRAALIARLALGLPVIAALILAAPVLGGSDAVAQGIVISAPLVLITPLVSAFTAVFRARGQMRPSALLNVGMLLAQVILTVIAFGAGWGITGALWVNVLSSAGQLVAAFLIWRARFAEPDDGQKVEVRELLTRAFPFAIAALIAALQMRLNIILLERAVSPEQAGVYTAAARFIEAGRLVPQAAFDALLPFLALMVAQPVAFKRTFGLAVKGLSGYGIAFGILFWLLAYVLIHLFFGDSFDQSAEVLRVLAWSLLPMSLKYLRSLFLYALKYENWVNKVSFFALIGQLIAALIVLPAHGAIGAAWVALISESITAAVLWFVKPPAKPQ